MPLLPSAPRSFTLLEAAIYAALVTNSLAVVLGARANAQGPDGTVPAGRAPSRASPYAIRRDLIVGQYGLGRAERLGPRLAAATAKRVQHWAPKAGLEWHEFAGHTVTRGPRELPNHFFATTGAGGVRCADRGIVARQSFHCSPAAGRCARAIRRVSAKSGISNRRRNAAPAVFWPMLAPTNGGDP